MCVARVTDSSSQFFFFFLVEANTYFWGDYSNFWYIILKKILKVPKM